MSDPYLIAHKVRGEAAFDIAIRMVCPLCQEYISVTGVTCYPEGDQALCHECDGEGYWWIVPTSGHRAYPLMHWQLNSLVCWAADDPNEVNVLTEAGPLTQHPAWVALPDHYPNRDTAPKINLIEALGLTIRPPRIDRRI